MDNQSPSTELRDQQSFEASRRLLLKGLAIGGATALGATLFSPSSAEASPTFTVFNVKDYGAIGNGSTIDTSAVQAAINAAMSAGGGTVYFPSGNYLINSTLTINTQVRLEILGNGLTSTISWGFNGNLFQWAAGISCREVIFRDLRIVPTINLSASSSAIYCTGGVERSIFSNLLVINSGGFNVGTAIYMNGVSDTTTISNCVFWGVIGKGIRIGHGSEVRVIGGRILGVNRTVGSIGIHVTGDNGGVHVFGTDLINCEYGMRIDNSSGAGTNREIFTSHATFDSCYRGLAIFDSSYVSVIGCWAASCTHENIYVEAFISPGPLLVINGGTIFNAGNIAVADAGFGSHGIAVNSGTFQIVGVSVRNNYNASTNPNGKGIWVPSSAVKDYIIMGCRIANNGVGISLQGSHFICTNNILVGNVTNITNVGTNFLVNNNL